MSSQNVFHETKDLSTNLLTLVDDMFYDFVEKRLGVYQSSLLKIQQINSVSCFLLIHDPCEHAIRKLARIVITKNVFIYEKKFYL
jgi:hypothetical protein